MSFRRLATAGLGALLVGAAVACGSLLGIDSGTPRDGSGGDSSLVDAGVIDDAPVTTDDSSSPPPPSDGGFVPVDSGTGCTPDLNWCTAHCGSGPDNCNQPRGCSSLCPQGESCTSNSCECQTDPTWCNGRCDKTTDNCGNTIACASCEAGVTCYSGVCGCMPEPASTTCAGKQCGSALNNCNLTVNCGVNNSTECDSSQTCLANETCCTPDNTTACGGRCQVNATNNCGQSVPCPQTCPGGQACVNSVCCTATGCGGACIDNCGQPNASCCPPDAGSPPPVDSGSPPPDAGGCGTPGVSCKYGCCSSFCGYAYTCVTSCQSAGTKCSTTADCCYGLTCGSGGIVPLGTAQNPALVVQPFQTCQTGVSTAQ